MFWDSVLGLLCFNLVCFFIFACVVILPVFGLGLWCAVGLRFAFSVGGLT